MIRVVVVGGGGRSGGRDLAGACERVRAWSSLCRAAITAHARDGHFHT